MEINLHITLTNVK